MPARTERFPKSRFTFAPFSADGAWAALRSAQVRRAHRRAGLRRQRFSRMIRALLIVARTIPASAQTTAAIAPLPKR